MLLIFQSLENVFLKLCQEDVAGTPADLVQDTKQVEFYIKQVELYIKRVDFTQNR